MAYGDFKDLTASDKILRDKAFNIAKNPKDDGYQRGLASIVYKFFDKNTSDGAVKNENTSNKELAEEINKLIIKQFKKRKVHPSFIDNVWRAALTDMQLISKFNKGIRFLLHVAHIYRKYAWVIHLKDKKGITITHAFQIILKESNQKLNKIWVGKGSEFDYKSMKSCLEKII